MSIISTVPKGAAVEGINPNLLDNWCLAGGGTGQGVFPVNQRGQTSYTTGTYCVDRWMFNNSATLHSGGLITTGSISQYLESSRAVPNQVYTVTALLDNNGTQTLYTKTGALYTTNDAWQLVDGTANSNGIAVRYYSGKWHFAVWNNESNRKIVATKFEKGSEQTLVHQENGVWVLNEVPDYGEELRKCQRYYIAYSIPSGTAMAVNGLRGDMSAGTNIGAQIDLPIVMARVPTVDAVLHSIRGHGSNWNTGLSVTSTPLGMWANHIAIEVIASNASFPGLTNGYAVLFSKLNLSAEL